MNINNIYFPQYYVVLPCIQLFKQIHIYINIYKQYCNELTFRKVYIIPICIDIIVYILYISFIDYFYVYI